MEEDSGNPNKRPRVEVAAEESGDQPPPPPEAKRRIAAAEEILGILDDDCAAASAAAAELASVMRSFEAEIALPTPPRDDPDLGFLFAASDDELGLPPPPLHGGDAAAEESGGVFSEIWRFDEDTHLAAAAEVGRGKGFEGFGDDDDDEEIVGLVECADVMMSCGPSDLADASWRSESFPAV